MTIHYSKRSFKESKGAHSGKSKIILFYQIFIPRYNCKLQGIQAHGMRTSNQKHMRATK